MPQDLSTFQDVAAVAIGRNEGARLIDCLDALRGQVGRIIYVDSGSTDGSVDAALARGVEVVDLDMSKPFTAARARNAGIAALMDRTGYSPRYIQFLDGDCALQDGWLATARAFLEGRPMAAVACGRRRERFPEASVYNRLIDKEWDTPVGQAKACGGDALIRTSALSAVGGYNPALIAGEEPEMCVRLRALGWEVWRLDAEMTLHDAAILRFDQWWKRAKRAGHAYLEGAILHGAPPERHFVAQTWRALIWGALLPLLILCAAVLVSPWVLLVLAIYPAQVARIAGRSGDLAEAFFLTVAKFAEVGGMALYLRRRLSGSQKRLIEYK